MSEISKYIGVDISKLDFHVYEKETKKVRIYKNTEAGIKGFIKTIEPNSQVILEATGSYSMALCYYLQEADILFTLVSGKLIALLR